MEIRKIKSQNKCGLQTEDHKNMKIKSGLSYFLGARSWYKRKRFWIYTSQLLSDKAFNISEPHFLQLKMKQHLYLKRERILWENLQISQFSCLESYDQWSVAISHSTLRNLVIVISIKGHFQKRSWKKEVIKKWTYN